MKAKHIYKTIDSYDFFILLESYIDQLEIDSPLYKFITEAPLEQWDTSNYEAKKNALYTKLNQNDLEIFKKIIDILAFPSYHYTISWRFNTNNYMNNLYEKDGFVTELRFDAKGLFILEPPKKHHEKILSYIELIDISQYQMDYIQPIHQMSYTSYLTLHLAFLLEETSRVVGIDEKGNFMHFTVEDLIEEFQDEDYVFIKDMLPLFDDDESSFHTLNIPMEVELLIENSYLTKISENRLTIGTKAIALFENFYTLNKSYFSVFTNNYIDGNREKQYQLFQYTKNCCCSFNNKNGIVYIRFLPNSQELEKELLQTFSLSTN